MWKDHFDRMNMAALSNLNANVMHCRSLIIEAVHRMSAQRVKSLNLIDQGFIPFRACELSRSK